MANLTINKNCLIITGKLDKHSVPLVDKQLDKIDLSICKTLDITELEFMDAAGVAFIDSILVKAKKGGQEYPLTFGSDALTLAYRTFTSKDIKASIIPAKNNIFEFLGQLVYSFLAKFWDALHLTADIFWYSAKGIVTSKGRRAGSIVRQSLAIGVDSIPIVGLLSFIIGIILALQGAVQLKKFGADVFIAELLALSVIREMGPMMTAIIIAGRSGSAIAAEIATMKVTEELDALKMMALSPIQWVIVPKFIAITICMPLIVVISIIISMLGGLMVAMSYLDVSAQTFFAKAVESVNYKDLFLTMSKSVVFAWVIVVIGSYFGMAVSGGAEGVGKATTSSVVASIFTVIVFDALFSFLYL